ncbi:MAG: hypothetical protein QOE55_3702, partial [Acidobacteriaceae bacterium]|nr:hypothetical protein [Acidobacteriaceae bacterium]
IGIHVGDIIFDDNDIFGDGVNIAARLEGIAQPGGICISDDAQHQIRGKLDSPFEDMGPQHLKNIAEPMRARRLSVDAKSVEYLSTERFAAISVSALRTRVSLICDGAVFASFRLVRECMLKRPQITEALDVGYLTKRLPGGPSYSLLHSLKLKPGLHRGDT